MRRRQRARIARWVAFTALALGVFEACSNSDDSTAIPPPGPPDIEITMPLDAVACDGSLVVHLVLTNWTTRPPGNCGTTPQCGSVQVTLETPNGTIYTQRTAAGALRPGTTTIRDSDVQLDLTALLAQDPTLPDTYSLKAELLSDALQPVVASPGGQTSSTVPVALVPAIGCSDQAGTSSGGAAGATSGSAGASGAPVPVGEGGAGGVSSAGTVPAGAGGEVAASGAAPI
jgi:hypothetical protein